MVDVKLLWFLAWAVLALNAIVIAIHSNSISSLIALAMTYVGYQMGRVSCQQF